MGLGEGDCTLVGVLGCGMRCYETGMLAQPTRLLQNSLRREPVGPLARSLPAFVIDTFIEDNR